ncbi:hypothetical protein PHMEG_00034248 [Phytophthora megakarya]|uniref:Uncharacterized protein n=1 Tax=Phytophthora megakarya TaxID=4795 RepID=A0A225URS2_9STRA|nr:hypothetical protein PHMEG_00034248 [Phytophthora megakarya]
MPRCHHHYSSRASSASEYSADASEDSGDSDADSESPPPRTRKEGKKRRPRRSPVTHKKLAKRRKRKCSGRASHESTPRRRRRPVYSDVDEPTTGSAYSSSTSKTSAATVGKISAQADEGDDGESVVATEAPVHAPALDVTAFDNWTLSVRKNTPVRRHNAKIAATNLACLPIPDHFRFYNQTYVCTHYRPPVTAMAVAPGLINTPGEVDGNLYHEAEHHAVGREVYRQYHEARVVSDEEVLLHGYALHRAGANRKRILAENTDDLPSMKDIHNLVARLKCESYAFPSVEERIRAILENFASKSGNIARVYTN